MRTRPLIICIYLLIDLVVPTLLSIGVQPSSLKSDMESSTGNAREMFGLFASRDNVYGMLESETSPEGVSYRWTTEHSTIIFPYAANAGSKITARIRLAANMAPRQSPADVELILNGKLHDHFTVSGGFRVYTASLDTRDLPNPYLDPAHVQVELQTTPVSIPGSTKQVGVAVDWIELQPRWSSEDIIIETAVWVLSLVLILVVAQVRFRKRLSSLYGLFPLCSFILLRLTYVPRGIPLAIEIGLAGLAWILAILLAPRQHLFWVLVLAVLGLWLVVAGRLFGEWQMDDAYITYRYAWNLVHGNGLVYNPGEVVEGYTNFLWTMLAAGALAVGLQPALVSLTVTIALSQCLVGLTWLVMSRLSMLNYLWSSLAAGLLAIDPSLLFYGPLGSGMESILFAFLVLLSAAFLWVVEGEADASRGAGKMLVAARAAGGVSLALSSLTRPEGLLVAVIFLGTRTWQDFSMRRQGNQKHPGRSLIYALVPFLVIAGAYQIWRITFYGYFLPNTFYDKTGLSAALIWRGLVYCWNFLVEHWLITVLAVVGLELFILVWRRKPPSMISLGLGDKSLFKVAGVRLAFALLALFYTLYIVAVGGDHFPAARFFVPLLAPLVLLALEVARVGLRILPQSSPAHRGVAALLVVAMVIYAGSSLWLAHPRGSIQEFANDESAEVNLWGSMALWVRDNTPSQTLIASPLAGVVAYYSERRVVDMLGLNDLHIARMSVANMGAGLAGHEKADPVYVLSKHPDYIVPRLDYFKPIENQFETEYELRTTRVPTGVEIIWYHKTPSR